VDKNGMGVLHCAAMYGCLNAIDYLMTDGGVLVNVVDSKGITPLHYACKYCSVEAVKALLVFNDINVSMRDSKGKRPVDLLKNLRKKDNGNLLV
ncbi:ankyrin repeat domain-containing protein, partial [Escherichia coli]|uniref:ankyrin repeat domain-containing protein n=1 Tax=Escherichia coli TaxID=562 RepID=UPI0013721997